MKRRKKRRKEKAAKEDGVEAVDAEADDDGPTAGDEMAALANYFSKQKLRGFSFRGEGPVQAMRLCTTSLHQLAPEFGAKDLVWCATSGLVAVGFEIAKGAFHGVISKAGFAMRWLTHQGQSRAVPTTPHPH